MTDDQTKELLRLLRETHALVTRHVQIAEEYKAQVGDPLRRALTAGNIVWKAVVIVIGFGLTLSAIMEWWTGFISRHMKP
jgi:hypothetical protein